MTVLDALNVIQCITLVSFFSKISIGSFWGWNLHFFTFEETVGSHLNGNMLCHYFSGRKRSFRCLFPAIGKWIYMNLKQINCKAFELAILKTEELEPLGEGYFSISIFANTKDLDHWWHTSITKPKHGKTHALLQHSTALISGLFRIM